MTSQKKIIFENPENRNRESIVLNDSVNTSNQTGFKTTEFSLWRDAYDEVKGLGMVDMPGKGKVLKSSIKAIFDIYPEKKEFDYMNMKTRMDRDPPSKEEWNAIIRVVYEKPNINAMTPLIIKGICMSIWNFNNDITLRAIAKGKELMKNKKDFKWGQYYC